MALDHQQKIIFDRRINQMKEEGFFLPSTRSLSGDDRHLIISFGGTGADALFGVKKKFENILSKKELEERVRFLAIDTDASTQKQTQEVIRADGGKDIIEVDSLTAAQFFQLPGDAARRLFDSALDENVRSWLNPQLERAIRTNEDKYLNGKGASGTRQIGRLTLYPASTVAALSARISALASELTTGNVAKLKVFILTGIAGGTGSGTVVDLTYLIRDVINSLPAVPNTRTKYCGFVLMPSTGKSSNPIDIEHGNRNGYAALKEINHFMTLRQREDTYSFTYGNGKVVNSQDKIFDICYLMDGYTGEMAYSDPRAEAVKVVSESILDMITASQTAGDGVVVQAVDSFMNDEDKFRKDMVASQPTTRAVRDADYVYCALGHSEFAIPANEIKAYVGKQMFDRIYALFLKCDNVEAEDVQQFLTNVIRRGVSTKSAAIKAMDEEIELIFTDLAGAKGGPFYTINLLKEVAEGVATIRNKLQLFRPGRVNDQSLKYIEDYAVKVNHETFEAYTLAMESLKQLMESQFGAVVKAGISGNVYSFMPLTLGAAGDKAEIVIHYLDSLVNKATVKSLTIKLLHEMLDNRDQWVSLVSSDVSNGNKAAAAMRRFWNTELDAIVDSTLEDFLIKYYSGNPDAHYSIETHAVTRQYLQEAAVAIYNAMLGEGGAAQPLVNLTPNGLTADNFNGHTYLMVPRSAPHLLSELKQVAAIRSTPANDVKVCESFSRDRVSCYKQYTSIPTFKLDWALRAEKVYEEAVVKPHGIGMHMSETVGGRQWKNFPNLLPMSCWPLLPGAYHNGREATLAAFAHTLTDNALALGLAEGKLALAGTQNIEYTAMLLPASYRPDEQLYRELDRCIPGSDMERSMLQNINDAAEAAATALFALVGDWESEYDILRTLADAGVDFKRRNLWFSDAILTVGPGESGSAEWDKYIAGCMLRKLPEAMHQLDGTVLVMKKLAAKVHKSVQARTLIKRFAQYLVVDMFRFNEDTETWEYTDENGFDKELFSVDSVVEKAGEYYFMFNAFRDDPAGIEKALAGQFAEFLPTDRATKVARQKAFKARGAGLKAELAGWINTRPMKPYERFARTKGYNPEAIVSFYRALYNEAAEIELIGYLHADIGSDEADPDTDIPDVIF